ncbi:hypothetical protein NQ317_009149 [Molorchus minor]|uniref:C2H2-type domain-containing protein n=1 Tax=Molorchus minor TaxID=1323400 RepID=A0ABQ9K0M6_9CUCU|nr:hypothetical protein NQ317_009149 [Molorchus minor]
MFTCNLCLENFKTQNGLGIHINSHEEKFYKCSVCENGFRTKFGLGIPMRGHVEKHYNCSICQYETKNQHDMKLHIDIKHKKPLGRRIDFNTSLVRIFILIYETFHKKTIYYIFGRGIPQDSQASVLSSPNTLCENEEDNPTRLNRLTVKVLQHLTTYVTLTSIVVSAAGGRYQTLYDLVKPGKVEISSKKCGNPATDHLLVHQPITC